MILLRPSLAYRVRKLGPCRSRMCIANMSGGFFGVISLKPSERQNAFRLDHFSEMPKYLLPLICCFILAGCGTTYNTTDGTGYKKLTPNASTRQHILKHDLPFAKQVAGHNRQCAKDAGCK